MYNIHGFRVPWQFLVFATAAANVRASNSDVECDLYIAKSTIPNAGLGIFTGVAKSKGDTIGNGDKSIPIVDFYWNNGKYDDADYLNRFFFNPLREYVWHGVGMGMDYESDNEDDILAFWPGMDAMVNCHLGLVNTVKAVPIYDEGGLHRSVHPSAGGITPYGGGLTYVIRDIPVGGEIFKHYGDHWFESREEMFGKIPLTDDYEDFLSLMSWLKDKPYTVESTATLPPSAIYEELIRGIKDIWDSRTLNALHHFTWDEIILALEAQDMGIIYKAMPQDRWIGYVQMESVSTTLCIDHRQSTERGKFLLFRG